ncbi:MAG: redoxin domain-containing protein [Elusimicrobia bacterium]|nr:redoxin domain-containing protein [Elusimicrobiota bacterium]
MKTTTALLAALLLAASASAKTPGPGPAPDFTVGTVLNAPVRRASLKSLRGKVVYLEFWATWCQPCVDEIPHISRLAEDYRGKPVVFLSVTDEPKAKVERFLKTHPTKAWIGVDDLGDVFKTYGIDARPAGFLIDAHGRLLGRLFPSDLRAADVDAALAGKTPPDLEVSPAASPAPAGAKPLYEVRLAPGVAGPYTYSFDKDDIDGNNLPFDLAASMAYGIDQFQVELETAPPVAALDLSVRSPGVPPAADLLREALERTFGVRAKRVRIRREAYVLERLPGAKAPTPLDHQGHGPTAYGGGVFRGEATIAQLAAFLQSELGGFVVDESGLKGWYAMDLSWDERKPETAKAALESSLGLTWKKARRKVEILKVAFPARRK